MSGFIPRDERPDEFAQWLIELRPVAAELDPGQLFFAAGREVEHRRRQQPFLLVFGYVAVLLLVTGSMAVILGYQARRIERLEQRLLVLQAVAPVSDMAARGEAVVPAHSGAGVAALDNSLQHSSLAMSPPHRGPLGLDLESLSDWPSIAKGHFRAVALDDQVDADQVDAARQDRPREYLTWLDARQRPWELAGIGDGAGTAWERLPNSHPPHNGL